MRSPADKSPDSQRQAVANEAPSQQGCSRTEIQFIDNRAETSNLRQLHEVANNSAQTQGLAQLKAIMNRSPRSTSMRNLQAMVDNDPHRATQRIQHSRSEGGTTELQTGSDDVSVQQAQKKAKPTMPTNTGVIQRAKHSVDEIIDALESVEFGGEDFETKIKLDSDTESEQGVTLKNIVRARLARLHAQRGDFDNDEEYTALQISYVTDAVGEYTAKSEHVNIPRMKDRISSLLLTHFGTAINAQFVDDNHSNAIALAKDLTGTDPVALYIKKMIPLDKAAEQIRQVAASTEKTAAVILKMYIQRFKDRVLGFSRAEVATGEQSAMYKGEHNPDFPIAELVGNLSTNLHDYVSGATTAYKVSDNHEWGDAIDIRFTELEGAIAPEGEGVEVQEGPLVPPHIAVLDSILEDDLKPKAQRYWDFMVTEINKEPILIIVTAEHLTGIEEESDEDNMDYKSMVEFMIKNKTISDLIKPDTESEETIPALETFNVAKDLASIGTTLTPRKKTYGPWREEKDTRAAQKQLNKGEYPTFGFVPYYPYRLAGGFVNSYYGDTVLKVKNTKKAGANYKWTDQGNLHGTAGEALVDLALKDKHQFLAAATYLIHDNMTILPTSKLEAIISGAVNVPGDIDEIIASTDSDVDMIFGKATSKTADRTLVEEPTWAENSLLLDNLLSRNIGDASAKKVFSHSRQHVIIRNRITRYLKQYDDFTSSETGVFTKSANPDKQRIQAVRMALQSKDWRNWRLPLRTFIENADPKWLSTPDSALKELKVLYRQLLTEQRKGTTINEHIRSHMND